jgi:hypothetical protein
LWTTVAFGAVVLGVGLRDAGSLVATMNRRWTESAAGPVLVGPADVHARARRFGLPTESASQSRWRYRAKTTIYDVLVGSSAGGERQFTTERDAPLSDGDIQAERLSSSKPGAPA